MGYLRKDKMKTTVVNIKKNKCDVYIGRPSIFGNPFTIGKHGSRAHVIERYKIYFYDRLKTDQEFYNAILKLKGKKLGCYCSPLCCHGDVIAKFLNEENPNE